MTVTSFSSEPLVSRLGYGAMGLSQSYGPADRTESFAVLDRLAESGCTFIDTADVYGNGHNEELIGEWLKKSGKKKACDASLKRLGVDCIDLYYQHRVDPNTHIEDTVSALAELVKGGKIRYIGLSEASAETIRRAHKIHPIAAVQLEYSPWTLDIEQNGILSTCNELGIAVVAFSPLGRGFLTGQYKSVDDFAPDDARRNMPRFQGEAFAQNLKIVDALQELATKKGVSLTQLTLAWVMRQGPNVIPIPGTKSVARLNENLGALSVTLTDEEDAAVRKVINSVPAVGERYAPAFLKLSNI